jgi:hypothetical protein
LERKERRGRVYLSIWGADVAYFAQRGHFGFYFVRERDGGEDGEVACGQAYCQSKYQFTVT